MNKNLKKLTSYILLLSVTLYSVPIYALTKDETVYTKLNSDGSIKSTVVNNHIKNPNNLYTLTDETDLLNILNINGNETFTQEGTTLTWQSDGKDIFYQGTTQKELPITTNIKYYLNDEEAELNDIIGSKGKIKIQMNFTNNEYHTVNIQGKNETLYTPFVVSTGFILDGENNKNIKVANGKVIENGKDYLIGAISVPGLYSSLNIEELKKLDEITIEYETTKFELPNIYIVMTPKILDEEDLKIFDKMDALYSNVYKLKSSIDEIEKGSNELLNGSKQINDGNKQVYETLEMITGKVNELNQGANELNQGIQKLNTAIDSLKLPNNFNPETIPSIINANNAAIQALEQLNTSNQYDQVIYALNEENKLLSKIVNEILPNLANLQNEKEKIKLLSIGSEKIYDGTSSLKEGLEKLTQSTKELSQGTSELYNGLNALNQGIQVFNSEGITKINNYVNGSIKPIHAKMNELIKLSNEYETFTISNKENTTTTKFIMNIDSIKVKKETKNTKSNTKEEKNLWQRFLDLFK